MAVLDFKRSTTTPSTLAKGTLQFVKVGSRFKMLVGDNANSPTEANYLPFEGGTLSGGLTLSTNIASPLILTRTGDVGINMNGSYLGVSGGVLRFGTSTTHANNATVWTSGNLTQASINNWNVAYGALYQDSRTIKPNTTPTQRVQFGFGSFSNNNTAPYSDFIHFGGYTDGSGGKQNLIAFKKSGGFGMRIYQGDSQSDVAYNEFVEVYHSGVMHISNHTVEATAAFIIPTVAPVDPEPNKLYLYIS